MCPITIRGVTARACRWRFMFRVVKIPDLGTKSESNIWKCCNDVIIRLRAHITCVTCYRNSRDVYKIVINSTNIGCVRRAIIIINSNGTARLVKIITLAYDSGEIPFNDITLRVHLVFWQDRCNSRF